MIYDRRLGGSLRLLTLPDSAFKAQDTQGLVMRRCTILLVEAGADSAESSVAYNPKTSDMTYPNKTEVECHVLEWCSRKRSRAVRSSYAAELLSLLDATNQGQVISMCLEEIVQGAISALELLNSDRAIPMDAGVDAKWGVGPHHR